MKTFIGTKLIKAKPMNRLDYNHYRGWQLPPDENGNDEGYLVEYVDLPNPNHPNHPKHKGYISWSPKDMFDHAYQPTQRMTFGMAVEALKAGEKVARNGWNGKGMWLLLVPASPNIKPVAGTPYSKAGIEAEVTIDAHIDMYTAQGSMQPGWLASQADMLADDWLIIT